MPKLTTHLDYSISPRTRRSTFSEESGAIIWFVAATVVAMLTFLAAMMSIGQAKIIRAELQAAADASAHAATTTLCGTRKCFQEALEVAIQTINKHIIHGSLDTDKKISLSAPTNEFISPDWIENDYEIRIHRGIWTNTRGPFSQPDADGFESVEGNWWTQNPGLPRFIAANSVKVSIQRKDVSSWLSLLPGNSFNIEADAIASRYDGQATCVAPFAITACSLLNNFYSEPTMEYHPEGDYMVSRSFTGLDRHCLSPTECAMPTYFWRYTGSDPPLWATYNPGEEPVPGEPFYRLTWGGTNFRPYDGLCIWTTYGMSTEGAHYGVVGIPGFPYNRPSDANEARIRQMLQSDDFCSDDLSRAFIGQMYYFVENGLREPETDDALWGQISNRNRGPDAYHPTYRDEFGDTFNVNWTLSNNHPSINVCAPHFEWGNCNSRRWGWGGRWGGCSGGGPCTPDRDPSQCFIGFYTNPDGVKVSYDTTVWKIKVPVIANRRGPCGYTRDLIWGNGPWESIDPNRETWEIVRFKTAIFIDSDIGQDPPVDPDPSCFPPPPEVYRHVSYNDSPATEMFPLNATSGPNYLGGTGALQLREGGNKRKTSQWEH